MPDRSGRRSPDALGQVPVLARRRAPLVLELDLTEPLAEEAPSDPLRAALARRRLPLRLVLGGLRRAAHDRRVRAVVVKLGGARSALDLGTAQEIRGAIDEVRRAGILTVAWAETFGEVGRGSVPYYLATAFEQIWLQPSGDVSLTGVASEVPFLREALDKVGVTPELAQRHEYKSAADVFTQRSFTPAHREMTERIVASLTDQIVDGVAAARSLDRGTVRDLVDRAPLFSEEALAAGLVDRLGYRDEIHAAVRDRVGGDPVLQYLARYVRSATGPSRRLTVRKPRVIALVHVHGPIHLGRSGRGPFTGRSAGSDTVCAALRTAAAADEVAAVVLRVDSPGGSYVASDAIWREVRRTRETGMPVVVSMGPVAASGGYFVSMGADEIVAEPATVTGSIGVVGGKAVVSGLTERLGIGHGAVPGGRHSLMFSPLHHFSDEEWERLGAWLDRVYADFTAKVAEGRGLSAARVDEVARGRVWTGADAAAVGLVDRLGGLAVAVEAARERAALPPAPAPVLRSFPRVPALARLRGPQSSEDPAGAAAAIPRSLGDVADRALQPLGLGPAPLMLPGDWRYR